MANQLKMALISSILSLRERGWSFRRIACELGVHRETVARHVRLAASKPAKAPAGNCACADRSAAVDSACESGDSADSGLEGAIVPNDQAGAQNSTSPEPCRSACAPWRDVILAKLAVGLSARRIYQDLVSEHGFAGSYYSVKRFVRKLGASSNVPYRRMECAPGEEAQVDFGTGAPVVGPDGKRRKTYVLRVVLSHSRKGYSEACFRQTTDDFLRALECAFRHFGGVPKTLVIDNLKAAVAHPDWFDPVLVPKVQSFCEHYGTVILPTRPRMPRHKGKVEAGVKYVKRNALKARVFSSLEDQNMFLRDWEATVADGRIHGTTRQQVGKLFREHERAALLPLPLELFPCFQEAQRRVHRDGHVDVAKSYYSVPPEYFGRTVWARWDSRTVRVFNQRFEQIALHVRREPGRFSTLGEHLAAEKIGGVERGAEWLLTKVRLVGSHTERWARAMLGQRGVEGVRVLQGLLSLTKKHSARALETACETAHSHGEYRLRTLRRLVGRDTAQQDQFEFASEHELIRPLSDYGAFVRAAIARGPVQSGFSRHGRANESAPRAQNPGDAHRRGLRVIHPPWSEYSSPGCTPAEPDSASSDNSNVVHVSSHDTYPLTTRSNAHE